MSKFLGEDVVAVCKPTEHVRQPQAEKKIVHRKWCPQGHGH